MIAVHIELYATRASILVFGACYLLLAALPWLLPLPLWMQFTTGAAVVVAAWPFFASRHGFSGLFPGSASEVRALRIEPHGGLSLVVGGTGLSDGRVLNVRSFRVPRFLRHYVQLALVLNDGRKITLLILPGICDADAFRRLRRYLLQKRAKTLPGGNVFPFKISTDTIKL